jgi:hypothetical protein
MPVQPPPPVRLSDEGPVARVHFRLWQIVLTLITVVITVWCFTIHVVPGIIATFIAKHVLVAILAAGLGMPPVDRRPPTAS